MAIKSDLGDRMKEYERASRVRLTRRLPMIIRVDGKAFHTLTRKLEKPWDSKMVDGMTEVAKALLKDVQGAKIAYVFSDEVSVLVTDNETIHTSAWFDKQVQKIVSVSASIATYAFSQCDLGRGLFDSRCFLLPDKTEVCNYFIERQFDCVRNSIMSLAQKHFSHKQLHKVNSGKAQDMLFKEKNINWNDCETWQKRGWCVTRESVIYGESPGSIPYYRTEIKPDWNIPTFTQDRQYIESLLVEEE